MVCSCRPGAAGGRGGGILTVLGKGWRVLRSSTNPYWVGTVARFHRCTICIVNVYIPPATSRYAPSSYIACLTEIVDWVADVRLT